MPPKSNCQRVHEGRPPGPCINCKREEVTKRYWHLSQRRDQPLFYTFVKNTYAFKDDDCICRMCEARFRKSLEMSHDTEETSSKRKFTKYDTAIDTRCAFETNDLNFTTAKFDSYGNLSYDLCEYTLHTAVNAENNDCSKQHVCFLQHMNMCEKNGAHSTSVNFDSFQSCFQIELDQNNNKEACISSQFFLCINHYKKYKKFKPQLECCICDKSIYSKRCVGILDDKIDMLNIFINQILEIEKTVVTSTFCKTSVCLSCYKHFNIFLRSEKSDLAMVRTDQFLEDSFSQYEVIQTDSSNIEIFCFRQLLEYVIENLKSYRSLLVSSLHLKYKNFVDSSIQDFSINIDNESICQVHKTTNWVYQMLKSTLGHALLVYSPPKKSTSRMVYRVGTDLAKALHSSILHNKSKIDKLEESNQALKKQIGHVLSDQDSSLKNKFSFEDSLKMFRGI